MEQLIRDMGNLFCPRPVEAKLPTPAYPVFQYARRLESSIQP